MRGVGGGGAADAQGWARGAAAADSLAERAAWETEAAAAAAAAAEEARAAEALKMKCDAELAEFRKERDEMDADRERSPRER